MPAYCVGLVAHLCLGPRPGAFLMATGHRMPTPSGQRLLWYAKEKLWVGMALALPRSH